MPGDPSLTPQAQTNRELWDEQSDAYQERHGEQLARSKGAAWGLWQIHESELEVLGEVADRDVLELGCGAAQWSIALHALGARITGLDNSSRQLEHARKLMAAAEADFPLVHASAEATGLPAESFDIVFCDFGGMTFADPHRTVPEVARLLRPGGLLAFSTNTPIVDLVWPAEAEHPGEQLILNYWEELHEMKPPNEPIGFQLPYGEWIALFRQNDLAIEALLELRPPADGLSSYRNEEDREWARRWPMEHIWKVRREKTS